MDRTIEFILEYKNNNSLWDCRCEDYHNRNIRFKCLTDMANEFKMTIGGVQKKINNLRTYFGKELKKTNQSKSGQGTSEGYNSKWEYFQELQFLADTIEKRKSVSNLDVDEEIIIGIDSEDEAEFQNAREFHEDLCEESESIETRRDQGFFQRFSNLQSEKNDERTTKKLKERTTGKDEQRTTPLSKKRMRYSESDQTPTQSSAKIARTEQKEITKKIVKALENEEDPDESFGVLVSDWLKQAPQNLKETLKLQIHLLCFKAINQKSLPDISELL